MNPSRKNLVPDGNTELSLELVVDEVEVISGQDPFHFKELEVEVIRGDHADFAPVQTALREVLPFPPSAKSKFHRAAEVAFEPVTA